MEYRCVATSIEGFVQQLAVAYITHGYWFYVMGYIPERKNPTCVDAKLIDRYGIAISKWARYRRKQQGLANVHYLRFNRTFILIATKGRHKFFEDEAWNIRDARRQPIPFAEYSIGYKMGADRKRHVSVRIAADRYLELKAELEELATRRSAESIERLFACFPFEPYAPVRRQILNIHRAVNRRRRKAGDSTVPIGALRFRRQPVKPFDLV